MTLPLLTVLGLITTVTLRLLTVSGLITTVTLPLFDGFEFIGVVGVDMTLVDLFADVYNVDNHVGYAMVFDAIDNRTFAHVLLPQPSSVCIRS